MGVVSVTIDIHILTQHEECSACKKEEHVSALSINSTSTSTAVSSVRMVKSSVLPWYAHLTTADLMSSTLSPSCLKSSIRLSAILHSGPMCCHVHLGVACCLAAVRILFHSSPLLQCRGSYWGRPYFEIMWLRSYANAIDGLHWFCLCILSMTSESSLPREGHLPSALYMVSAVSGPWATTVQLPPAWNERGWEGLADCWHGYIIYFSV